MILHLGEGTNFYLQGVNQYLLVRQPYVETNMRKS